MFGPLRYVFDKVVREGTLSVRDSKGRVHVYGDRTGARVAVHIKKRRVEKELTLNPQLALGEAYMNGDFVVEEGSIYDFLDIVLSNAQRRPFPKWLTRVEYLRRATKRLQQYNPVSRSRANVAHHYDIDGRIYDLFLDGDRQYSCAYFNDDWESAPDALEIAQLAKKRHLAAKLALDRVTAANPSILDIGSG